MWKKLLDTDYFLKFDNSLEITVTDYINLWSVKFSKRSFLKCLEDSNFGLEMDENDMVARGRQMLTNPDRLKKVRVEKNKESLNVFLTMSFGFPLHLHLKLQPGSKELFFQKVTLGLLTTVQDLKNSEHSLRTHLINKDKVIAEFKDEKGQLVFRSLKTEPFNDEEHKSKHMSYSEHFGETDIPESLLKKTVVIPETQIVEIKEEAMDTQETVETNRTQHDVKTKPGVNSQPNPKFDTSTVKKEPPIKDMNSSKGPGTELGDQNKLVKSDTSLQTSIKSDIHESQHHIVATNPSPNKRQRKKLNI